MSCAVRSMQMEIEEAALKKEDDNLSQERLEELAEGACRTAENTSIPRRLSGRMRRHSVEKLQKLREQIEDVNKQIQIAQTEV